MSSEQKKYHNWTLFLDRDGVINVRKIGDYVQNWTEFHYLPQADEAIVALSSIFQHIIVVTNQQGIGKRLMRESDLQVIHQQFKADIAQKGGKIDAIYYCPHLASTNCNCRKPHTGMALNAQKDFPEIDFKRTIMVGDSRSDLEMGEQLAMKNVLILGKGVYIPETLFNVAHLSIWEFYQSLLKNSDIK